MSVSISVAELKANYIQKLNTVTTYDAVLTSVIADVLSLAIDYLDEDDITTASDLPAALKRPLMKQCAYEFNRRNDLGLVSVTAPDGTLSKMEVAEWLSDVKTALDRHKYYTL
jgi:hypothetical protein